MGGRPAEAAGPVPVPSGGLAGGTGPAGRHRWVLDEPEIPFDLPVIYEDERLIVVDKPHFLATTPRGMWYRSTVLIRVRQAFGDPGIVPAHRLDRATAGILVLVRDPSARRAYQTLFQERRVHKVYECLAPARPLVHPRTGTVTGLDRPAPFPLVRRSRIVKRRGVLQAYEETGEVNAETLICLPGEDGRVNPGPGLRRYVLIPRTGKTHQLRVHMNSLGLPILGDDLYPQVKDRPYDDFSSPLQLVARLLEFTDPYTGDRMRFLSRIPLEGG